MAANVLDTVQQELVPACGPASLSHGMLVLVLAPAELLPAVQRLKREFAFDIFLDVTAVDWLGQAPRCRVSRRARATC